MKRAIYVRKHLRKGKPVRAHWKLSRPAFWHFYDSAYRAGLKDSLYPGKPKEKLKKILKEAESYGADGGELLKIEEAYGDD